jgi:inosine/xanthosine triphosphate pyrophosphatase family protein
MTTPVIYATKSAFKQAELEAWVAEGNLKDGRPVSDAVKFDVRTIDVKEVLDVNLEVIVYEESRRAYEQLRLPCIVEHAGLIFEHRREQHYPGGLTKPMWNALGDRFVEETATAGRRAIARAAVGYCDGSSVRTFVGETHGTIAEAPRGERKFYWDTIFIPDVPEGTPPGMTYAEIVEHDDYGLKFKVAELSQSFKAMKEFLNYRLQNDPPLWNTKYE